MIPPNRKLRQSLNLNQIKYFTLNYSKSFFRIAEEYIALQTKFIKDTFYEKLSLWIDMLISPIISILMCLYSKKLPSMFTMLSLQKTFTIWMDWFRFKELSADIREWTNIVRAIGGPFISTNDPTYHIFVYADGMQRLRDVLFT